MSFSPTPFARNCHSIRRLEFSGVILGSLLFVGCPDRSTNEPSTKPAASAQRLPSTSSGEKPTSAPSTVVSSTPQALPQEAPTQPQPATDAAIRGAVQRWNDAIVSRSPERLKDIYASRVEFYGQSKSREQVVSDKMKALERAPDFAQTVSAIRVTWAPKDRPVASFEKQWSGGGKSGKVEAWLRLARERSEWRVALESDGPTDDMKARAHSLSKVCKAAVIELVLSTSEAAARRATQGPTATRDLNGVSLEGVNWPILSVSIHEMDEAGMRNTVAWFAVDAVAATVVELELPSFKPGPPLVTQEAPRLAVRKACRKP